MTTSNDILLENVSRCFDCNLISSLLIYYKNGKSFINYFCENNHRGAMPLEEYMQKYKNHSLLKEKCSECNNNQNQANNILSFCTKCNKFLCHSCIITHSNNPQHNTTNINRYDALCKLHSNYYGFYCYTCKKNLCMYCRNEHSSHNIIDLINFKNTVQSKQNIEDKIKNIEAKIKNLEDIKNNIINEIDIIKKSSELDIQFYNVLLNTFKYEENQNNLNYYVIHNIIYFDEAFEKYRVKLLDRINFESNQFISLLKAIGFRDSFRNLRDHTYNIHHLSILKDGRLDSCSADKALNIYKKDTFELQLSIKIHSNSISYFTQLKNDYILTCSADNTMKIIKLTNDNRYILEQNLTGHSNYICKAIEIRDNVLISIALDKTMKIWNINNNKYECTNTVNFCNSVDWPNILKLNENEFVISGDKCLKFWNSNNYTNISNISNIECSWPSRSLYKLDDDILCVGGYKGFYLIKISTHQLIKNIIGQSVYSIYKCLDGLFLCSIYENNNKSLVKYKYENQNFNKIIEIEKVSNSYINACIELNDEIVASGGNDNIIRLWK